MELEIVNAAVRVLYSHPGSEVLRFLRWGLHCGLLEIGLDCVFGV